MMILVAALEPLKEIIFPEQPWDKRGKRHIKAYLNQCKRTIRALMVDLNLMEMHKETKNVMDEPADEKYTVDAVAKPLEPENEAQPAKPKGGKLENEKNDDKRDLTQ